MKSIKIMMCLTLSFILNSSIAQYSVYSCANAHSHNDYENTKPFFEAYDQNFGSIEADIFYYNDSLFVGHVLADIKKKRTLQELYLDPLNKKIQENKKYPYADSTKHLQLLIDIKTESQRTINKLVEILNTYPVIITSTNIKIVITGNRPNQKTFISYPSYLFFDGDIDKDYTPQELTKIGLFSADFTQFSNWNGKGIMIKEDRSKVDSIVNATHDKNKKIRFWASPDYLNAWSQFIKMKVDYINTDHIIELGKYLKNLSNTTAIANNIQATYQPKYINDGLDFQVKQIILLIGDGCSLPQWYAGYTANGGSLTTFNLKHIGLSKTSSADNYVTDSAPGASSLATGEKIENRHLGVNLKGEKLKLITDYLAEKQFSIGLISSGDVSDATPAAFFAHENDRDSSIQIIQQLNKSKVQILAGAGNEKINKISILQKKSGAQFSSQILESLLPNYKLLNSLNELTKPSKTKMLIIDKQAGQSIQEGRGQWLSNSFDKIIPSLETNSNKQFFLMAEAAQIDYGGHANNLDYVIKEVLDFDLIISKAIKYADDNKGTLVVITGDHETGGLTLLDGNYKTQMVSGQFSTNDHSGIPVPVFSYGYRSYLFDGVYENTEIFNKLMAALK